MHRRLRRPPVRRYVSAVVIACVMAGVLGVVTVRANEGPYRPLICQHLDPLDILWWYYECWLPPNPEDGKAT